MNVTTSISTLEPNPGIKVPGIKPVTAGAPVKTETTDNEPKKPVKSEKVAEIQTILSKHDITMEFSTNEPTNQVVVKLVDDKTGEVIRQLPNDVSLKLAAANIKLQGWIFDETV